MANLRSATSAVSIMSQDELKEELKSTAAHLDTAETNLKQTKDKSAASLHKQKTEASSYATSARVGQITITGGNLAALIALYKQTSENGGGNKFANAVQALILTSICLSGVLLMLQVLLANISPIKNDTGLYWQLMNAYHHRMQLLFFWLCCCFGRRPPKDSGSSDLSGGSYHPVQNKDPEAATGGQGAQQNDTAPRPQNPAKPSDIESGMPPSTQPAAPAQAGVTTPPEENVFDSWQQDMNTTITLLGSVLTLLNSIIAGLTGTGQG